MSENCINRETILNDLDRDMKAMNKKRLSAKENHCVEDQMRYAAVLNHLIGFREYISLPAAYVVDKEKINDAVEEIHSCEHDNGEMFDKGMTHALGIFMRHIEEV